MILEIKKTLSCFGDVGYFGYKDRNQYTEDYYSIDELIGEYPEFKEAIIVFNGENDYNLENSATGKWKFKIVKGMELVTENIVEEIEKFNGEIFFNDIKGEHWVFDFKVDSVWVEALVVNCNNMTMDLSLFQSNP